MTPKQLLNSLAGTDEAMNVRLPDIRIGKYDSMAAKLLLWLEDEMPKDSTHGDLLEVLDSAKWWCVTFGAMHLADEDSSLAGNGS